MGVSFVMKNAKDLGCRKFEFRKPYPDDYPDALIRTVQRRVTIWRGDMARSLVFGPNGDAQPQMTSDALRNLEAARVRGHLQTTEPETEKGGPSQEQLVEATT